MEIRHAFESEKDDGGDASLVKPSDWNAGHRIIDPIEALFGTPDTAFEFDTSSLTGLTALGTAAAEDADTTVAGHYYVKNTQTGAPYWSGRYTTVSAPFTAITKFTNNAQSNYHCSALFISTATPGAFDFLSQGFNGVSTNGGIALLRWSSNSAYSNNPANLGLAHFGTWWLAIVATSTTNVAYHASTDGKTWRRVILARDPSMTIGSVGIAASAQDSTYGVSAAFDYLRIWNSALTLPGT